MKKLFLVLAAFVVLVSSSSAQLSFFTAKDAYNYIKTKNLLDGYKLTSLMAIQNSQIPMAEVDLLAGKGKIWVATAKSNDETDTIPKGLLLMSILGNISHQDVDASTESTVGMQSLGETWVNSTEVAVKIKENEQFVKFINDNDDKFQMVIMGLLYHPQFNTEVWMTSAMVSEETVGGCLYNATSADQIECTFMMTSIQDAVSKMLAAVPNPAKDMLSIELPEQGETEYYIYNEVGNIVKSDKSNFGDKLLLNVNDLPNGVYSILINNAGKTFNSRVTVVR